MLKHLLYKTRYLIQTYFLFGFTEAPGKNSKPSGKSLLIKIWGNRYRVNRCEDQLELMEKSSCGALSEVEEIHPVVKVAGW